MMRTHRATLIASFVVVAVLLGGCGGSEEPVTPLPDEGVTGQMILDGEELVAERCTTCHDTARIDDAGYDAVGWEATVDRMVSKGAQLTDDEKTAVIEYLSTR